MATRARACNRATTVAVGRAHSRAVLAPHMDHLSKGLQHTCNSSNPSSSSSSRNYLRTMHRQDTRPTKPVFHRLAPMEPSNLVRCTVGKLQRHNRDMEPRQARHPTPHSSLCMVNRHLAPLCLVRSNQGPCSSQHMACREELDPHIRRPMQAR